MLGFDSIHFLRGSVGVCLCILMCSKKSPKVFDALHLASTGVILRAFLFFFFLLFLCFLFFWPICILLGFWFPQGKCDIILWILYHVVYTTIMQPNTATLTPRWGVCWASHRMYFIAPRDPCLSECRVLVSPSYYKKQSSGFRFRFRTCGNKRNSQ